MTKYIIGSGRRQFLRMATLSLVALLAVTATATPVKADTPAVRWQNWGNGQCLDSNHSGAVYTLDCQVGNWHQTWNVLESEGGLGYVRLKNRATERCLTWEFWQNPLRVVFRTTADCSTTNTWFELQGKNWSDTRIAGGWFSNNCLDSGHPDPGPVAEFRVNSSHDNTCNYGRFQTWRSI